MHPRPIVATVFLALPVWAQTWTQVVTTGAPPARAFHAMAYDPAHGVTLLFGGLNASNVRVNDTWTYDGTGWTQRTSPATPPARARMSVACDTARARIVLFGGEGPSGGNRLADTWEWDGTAWLQRAPVHAPSPRWGAVVTYDSTRQRTVLFGGNTAAGPVDDTWEWDGQDWAQVVTATAPPALDPQFQMAFDPARGVCVLLSGAYVTGAETWEYDGAAWRRLVPTSNTDQRRGYAMAYDSLRQRVVVHGGKGGSVGQILLDDTNEYDSRQWFTWNHVLPRSEGAMCYDTQRGRLVLFGGSSAAGRLNDTWECTHPGPPPVATPFGSGCPAQSGPGTVQPASTTGGSTAALGRMFRVAIGGTAPFGLVFLVLGASNVSWNGFPLPIDLTPAGAPGCWLYTDFAALFAGVATNLGVKTYDLPIPADPALLGGRFYLGGLLWAPGINALGLTTANALDCSFGQ